MDFNKHLKTIGKTGMELGAMTAGAIAANKWIDETKIFKNDFAKNPAWFKNDRKGAPFLIKWSGGIQAAGALLAASYVKNPWAKLFLIGVAFAGGIKQIRIITWDASKNVERVKMIGAEGKSAEQLDAELRAYAQNYRTRGPEYISEATVDGPEYISTDNYHTSVAGDQYQSGVAYVEEVGAFDIRPSDTSSVAYAE